MISSCGLANFIGCRSLHIFNHISFFNSAVISIHGVIRNADRAENSPDCDNRFLYWPEELNPLFTAHRLGARGASSVFAT